MLDVSKKTSAAEGEACDSAGFIVFDRSRDDAVELAGSLFCSSPSKDLDFKAGSVTVSVAVIVDTSVFDIDTVWVSFADLGSTRSVTSPVIMLNRSLKSLLMR